MKIRLAIIAVLLTAQSARASGDGCAYGPVLEYSREDLSLCYQDLPILDLMNDSRGNMVLLFEAYLHGKEAPQAESSPDGSSPAELQPDQKPASPSETPAAQPYDWDKLRAVASEIFNGDAQDAPELPAAQPPTYSGDDFGDVRATNSTERAVEFILEAKKAVPAAELRELARERIKVLLNPGKDCPSIEAGLAAAGSEFSRYQAATAALYCLKYKEAAEIFCGLSSSANGWIRESAGYTCGRAKMLAAQVDWDGYSPVSEKIDRPLTEQAKAAFETYLKNYPSGRYGYSAGGLLRRTAYFLNDWQDYLERMTDVFSSAVDDNDIESANEYADEFDHYGLSAYYGNRAISSNPLLAADIMLVALRSPAAADLSAFSERLNFPSGPLPDQYSAYPGLGGFLTAVFALKSKNYEAAASAMPAADTPPQVQLAHLAIVAEADEQLKRWDEAIKIRRQIVGRGSELWPLDDYEDETSENLPLKQYYELMSSGGLPGNQEYYPLPLERIKLGLLRTYLRAGRRSDLLHLESKDAPKWAIQSVVERCYKEDELSTAFADQSNPAYVRDTAGRTLMRIYIASERFKDAIELGAKLSPRIKPEFEKIESVLPKLTVQSPAPRALIDYANFQIDDEIYAGDLSCQQGEVKSFTAGISPDSLRSDSLTNYRREPIQLFETAMLEAKAAHANEAEAEAAANLINCFRSGSWGWSCQGGASKEFLDKYPEAARKALFKRLKKELGKTEAGRNQKYWF